MTIRSTPFHWATVFIGFLFACAVLLPHILQRFDAEYSFQGIEFMAVDGEDYYASRVREVMDGFSGGGNTYYSSPKDQPAMQPTLPEWCIAQIGRLFHLEAASAFVLAKGILAFGLVLSMASFFTLATGKKWASLLVVTILLFAGSALHAPWNLPKFLFSSASLDALRFARLVNPLWSSLWFFAALAALASWLQDRRMWKILFLAFATAMMLYAYVYAWTYVGVVLGALFLWECYRRESLRIRDLLILAGCIAILGIPYVLNMWALIHHPWYADTAMRLGLVHLRTPIIGVWAMLFLLTAPLASRYWRHTAPLFPILALSGIIVLNQQVVTGMYLVPHHYHWYFLQPLASGTALLLIFSLFCNRAGSPRFIPSAAFALTLGSIVFGVAQQARFYRDTRVISGKRQGDMTVLTFLRERTHPGIVVSSTAWDSLAELIPIYTSADVYSANDANASLTSLERARERYFFDLWLRGISPENAQERFLTDLRAEVSSRIYGIYYRELLGQYTAIPDALLTEHASAYERYFSLSLEEKLSRAPLHYLVVEPGTPVTNALTALESRGTVVFSDDRYRVFSLEDKRP